MVTMFNLNCQFICPCRHGNWYGHLVLQVFNWVTVSYVCKPVCLLSRSWYMAGLNRDKYFWNIYTLCNFELTCRCDVTFGRTHNIMWETKCACNIESQQNACFDGYSVKVRNLPEITSHLILKLDRMCRFIIMSI